MKREKVSNLQFYCIPFEVIDFSLYSSSFFLVGCSSRKPVYALTLSKKIPRFTGAHPSIIAHLA